MLCLSSNFMMITALITTKILEKKYICGSGAYQPSPNKYIFIDSGNNKEIHSFKEGDIAVLNGKFAFRKDSDNNPLFVCTCIGNISVNLSNINNDLLIKIFANLSFLLVKLSHGHLKRHHGNLNQYQFAILM